MPTISLTFAESNTTGNNINFGDNVYYVPSSGGTPVFIGTVISIAGNIVNIDAVTGVQPPTTNDFIFYESSPMISIGSLKGYYAKVQMKNDSTNKVELFSVGSEVFESSK